MHKIKAKRDKERRRDLLGAICMRGELMRLGGVDRRQSAKMIAMRQAACPWRHSPSPRRPLSVSAPGSRGENSNKLLIGRGQHPAGRRHRCPPPPPSRAVALPLGARNWYAK